MKNYSLDNIVLYYNKICYINQVSPTVLWLHGEEMDFSTTNPNLLEDVELSDWFFNKLFEDKRSVDTWIMATSKDAPGNPIFWIWKEVEGVYLFQKITNGKTFCFVIDSVREFQNLYNFYREYYEWAECLVDIDERIKEIFKVV